LNNVARARAKLAGLAIVRGTASYLTFFLSLYFLPKNVKIEIDYDMGFKAILHQLLWLS
jgi:hypothetical protein